MATKPQPQLGQNMQQIKIALLDMINRGETPFDIIVATAEWLEKESGEPGYAKYLTEQLRAVYGYAFLQKKPLQDEEKEVKTRLQIMESRLTAEEFSDEVKERIGFAIERHKKQLAELEHLIKISPE